MDISTLANAALVTGYISLIATTIVTSLAWILTRVNKVVEWQRKVMKEAVRDVFNKEILPGIQEDFMTKIQCTGQHEVTDMNIMQMRETVHNMDKKLDRMLEHILNGNS